MTNEKYAKGLLKKKLMPAYRQRSDIRTGEISGQPSEKEDSVSENIYRLIEEKEAIKVQNLESLGLFAGGLAHEFNNILTIISGNISLIKTRTNPESEIDRSLKDMEKAFLSGKALVQKLITFSTGGAPVKEITTISHLIKESVMHSLRGAEAKCKFYLSQDLCSVEVDKEQMRQAIYNLIANADHALGDGGIIKVRTENVNLEPRNVLLLQKGKYVKITIEDNGSGIPPEHLQKIFYPYFTTKQRGYGLGLSATYSIIKRHGGSITVASKKGEGTIFTIYLPASQNERSFEFDESKNIVSITGKRRILVMDDKEMIRDVVKKMLMFFDYEVDVACNGEEAIMLYKRDKESGKPFDAVIMDLIVPGGMGGQETIRRLREIDPDVKGIVSSGYSEDPIMADYKKHGFIAVLPKPYRIQELSKILLKVLMRTG
ncbi:MAG: ATP-binding protein [Candidatus Scalindua sp.]|nr:ATP-binding protein [Candidatus Scalindua sp.]